MDKFCQNCNQSNPAEAVFCLNCAALLNAAAKAVSEKVGRRWIESTFNGVLLGEKQLPHIYGQAVRAARILGMSNMPDVYLSGERSWDCLTFGSDKDSFIVIGSALAGNFQDADMLFLLAREMGHCRAGQAKAEEYNMDNAVWHEEIADDAADNAAYYAEAGNFDVAESSAVYAADQQDVADHYGDLGEHGGDIGVYDPSSAVDTGGTYDSSYDSTAVDTGFDAGMDTSMDSGYDAGTDDI